MPRFLSSFLLTALLSCLTVHAQSAPPEDGILERLRTLTPYQMDEVLWLARCLYSESNLPHEQRLVAWVIRNRVETGFRGDTYREVVLEPRQFSAFNTQSARRDKILGLDQETSTLAWRSTLRVAYDVYFAHASDRPFARTTRHFYSPISMESSSPPAWAEEAEPLDTATLGVEAHRFQFFDQIDDALDPYVAAQEKPAARMAKRQQAIRDRVSRARPPSRRSSGRVKRPARPSLKPLRKQ